MARLIDADALKARLYKCVIIMPNGEKCMADRAIDAQPTITAEPKHGRWKTKVIHDTYCFQCSVCNSIYNGDTHYCPHCGAEMGGGAENG